MRTTVDLPDYLHRQAPSIAMDASRTLSATIAELVRRGMNQGERLGPLVSPMTGLPVIRLGMVVTSEDVRMLEDDTP